MTDGDVTGPGGTTHIDTGVTLTDVQQLHGAGVRGAQTLLCYRRPDLSYTIHQNVKFNIINVT